MTISEIVKRSHNRGVGHEETRTIFRPFHVPTAVALPALGALVIAKAFACGTWEWESVRFPAKLGLVVYQDVVFLLGWTFAWGVLLRLAGQRPRIRRGLTGSFIVGSSLVVLYGVINVWIYPALRMPLTYSLLAMGGDGVQLRSSIAPYLNWTIPLALGLALVVYLIAVRLLLRARWPSSARFLAVLAVVLTAYLPAGEYGYAHWYAGGPQDGVARSPHWALIESFIGHLRGDRAIDLRDTGPPTYQVDFRSAGDRRTRAALAPRSRNVKNVVVVVLESTGTQFLSVYGSPYPTTPHLQSAARHAMLFRNVYANAGYTLHSMMPLIVSQYPGTGWEIYVATHPHLRATSAAQALHHRGYRTAFFTGAALNYRGSRHFFEGRGFDVIRGFEDFQAMGRGTEVSSWGMDDPSLFDGVLDWLGQDAAKPFFAIVWTQQTHHPYTLAPGQKPLDFVGVNRDPMSPMLNLYLNDLRIADEQLGRLFEFLRQRGLDRSTIVLITGDHGEAFGFPHPWTFHGTALYEESIHVPCVLWSPTLFPQAKSSDVVGAHIDLNPTLFDVLGLPAPADWQGDSLFDPRRSQRAYFSCNTGYLLEGLRDGPEKYIYNLTLGREELYNIATDPAEQTNIEAGHPDRCREYRQRLAAWTRFERGHLKALTAAGLTLPAHPPLDPAVGNQP